MLDHHLSVTVTSATMKLGEPPQGPRPVHVVFTQKLCVLMQRCWSPDSQHEQRQARGLMGEISPDWRLVAMGGALPSQESTRE